VRRWQGVGSGGEEEEEEEHEEETEAERSNHEAGDTRVRLRLDREWMRDD
jgi:hypothetical protein